MIFLYVFATVILVIAISMVVDQVRLGRHKGLTRDQFVSALSKDGAPAETAGAVYDLYKNLSKSKTFGLNPDDTFDGFGIIHEDIDYDLEELVEKLGMEMSIEPVLLEWPTEVKTLRDMALWLHWVSQRQRRSTRVKISSARSPVR